MKLRYRQYGSMKGTKRLQLHVADETLVFLNSFTNQRGEPIGYGAAIDQAIEELRRLREVMAKVLHGTHL